MSNWTTQTSADTNVTQAPVTGSLSPLPTHAESTIFQAMTTAEPTSQTSAVVGVVIFVIVLTVAVLGFLLYRYLCHNKGDYRTTGELAPGEDLDEDISNQAPSEKKEYFI